jgi:DNA-binding response OmpR family regulator
MSERGSTPVTGTNDHQRHQLVIIEDEPDIADLLMLYFDREGWTTHWSRDGESGLEAIRARRPDLVVLDIGLPGMSGLEVCRELRNTSGVPVLFLTARDDEIDRVLGLELGADDYVTKPFSPREIVARINAILRRGRIDTAPTRAEFGPIAVDLERHEVSVDGTPVTLATQEFKLLAHLCANQGAVLSRQQLLDGAWGEGWFGDIRTVDVHVRQLRKKLGDDLPLATVRGAGYRLG